SRAAPTCAPFRRCSVTRTSPRPSCTRTYPIGDDGSCTTRRTRTRGDAREQRAREVGETGDMSLNPHIFVLAVLSCGVGYVMIVAGLQKSVLEWRRKRRNCPSCGRALESRVCPCCH